jgi:hypothetical protein
VDVTVSPAPSGGSTESGGTAPTNRHSYRAGFLIATVAVIISVVLLPFALISLVSADHHPVAQHDFDVMKGHALHGEWTKLNVATVSINEAAGSMSLRVTGYHYCMKQCDKPERVEFYSVHADPKGALGAPPSASIDLAGRTTVIDQLITLPISGNLIDYPFDHYHLLLGITLSKVSTAGTTTPFSRTATNSALDVSVNNAVPRLTLAAPKEERASLQSPARVTYDSLTALDFSRPTYLQILTALLTMLIVLAAAYGVLFRPFTQIIPTIGGLVLGVWGVRSLLVGSYPPDSTGVDLVLEGAILLLLLAVGIRSVVFMWPHTQFSRSNKKIGESEG